MREYIQEFSGLMLEIPDMSEKEALFCFLDGLTRWAKLELERRGVKDLATAMAVADSQIEFRRKEPSKGRRDESDDDGNGGGDRPASTKNGRNGKASWHDKGKEKADEGSSFKPKPKLECFICSGPHRAYECPKKEKLSAIVMERDERHEGEVASFGPSMLSSPNQRRRRKAGWSWKPKLGDIRCKLW